MKKKILSNFLFLVLKVLLIVLITINVSCRKDFSPSWETNLLVPIANTNLTINNIITDSLISENPDNSLSLVFRNDIYTFSPDSIFSFPDTITSKIYNVPLVLTIPPGQTIISLSEVNKLKFGSSDIIFGTIKSGKVSFKVINQLKEGVICNYKIPSATRYGSTFEINEYIPSNNGSNAFIKKYDISDFEIDFRGPNFNSSNRIMTSFTVTTDPNGNPLQTNPQDSLMIFVTFENLQIQYAKGYFGQTNHSFGPDTNYFNLFKNITGGNISLNSIKALMSVENAFGIDASVILNNLTAINTRTNQSVSLTSQLIGKPLNMTRAIETGINSTPVHPSYYSYNLSDGNIIKLIENMPDYISYSANIYINPLGNVSGGNDFVYYGNGLKTYLDFELPLSLIANNLSLADTVDFNLGSSIDKINDGILYLNTDNGFPFSADIKLYLLDENNNINDSLTTTEKIQAANINANNIVSSSKKTNVKIHISADKAEKLKNSKKMIIKIIFNTASQSNHLKLFSHYRLNIVVSADFKYIFNTEEF